MSSKGKPGHDQRTPKRRHKWWCVVCGSDEDDELKYGPFSKTKEFNVHFFCLLLSSIFEQRGRDSEGVYGFRIKDIEHGLELIKDTICWYCGHPNASIYCSKPGCRRVFHLTCGVESGCLSQFLGTFDSFCHKHSNDVFRYRNFKDDTCVICRDVLGFTCDAVQTDCCSSVFHRRCLGSLALSAGYFFKCPLCNNNEQFRRCMRQKGIYVPDRDASWELEENAYNELHTPKYSCEAVVCLSKHRQGREYNSVNGFAFMNCTSCGAGSIHQTCCPTPDYICEICTNLFDGSTNNNITIPANALETTENNNTLSDSVLNENRSFMSVRRPTRRSLPVRSTNSSRIQFTPDKRSPFKLRSSEYNGDDSTPKRRRLH